MNTSGGSAVERHLELGATENRWNQNSVSPVERLAGGAWGGGGWGLRGLGGGVGGGGRQGRAGGGEGRGGRLDAEGRGSTRDGRETRKELLGGQGRAPVGRGGRAECEKGIGNVRGVRG